MYYIECEMLDLHILEKHVQTFPSESLNLAGITNFNETFIAK